MAFHSDLLYHSTNSDRNDLPFPSQSANRLLRVTDGGLDIAGLGLSSNAYSRLHATIHYTRIEHLGGSLFYYEHELARGHATIINNDS